MPVQLVEIRRWRPVCVSGKAPTNPHLIHSLSEIATYGWSR